jgi:hypothetical protein
MTPWRTSFIAALAMVGIVIFWHLLARLRRGDATAIAMKGDRYRRLPVTRWGGGRRHEEGRNGSESSNARPLLGAGLPRSERDSQHHPAGVPAVETEARDVVGVAAARGCCARVSSRPRPPSGRSTSSCETPTPRCSSSKTSSTCHGSSRRRYASTYARSILRRSSRQRSARYGLRPTRRIVEANGGL